MSSPGKCLVPPAGWWCSRDAGHEGPCAARPIAEVPAEVAEVLQELIEEMTNRAMEHDDDWRSGGAPESWRVATGIRQARDMVEAAQSKAATGARAAGGESEAANVAYDRLLETIRRVTTDLDEEAVDCIADATMEAAEADRSLRCPYGGCPSSFLGQTAEIQLVKHWRHHAAPPSAPGVAELLAECARRQTHIAYCPWSGSVAHISCDEIVRLLAPGGDDV